MVFVSGASEGSTGSGSGLKRPRDGVTPDAYLLQ